ncbi:hypothetical protein RHMOL_Rhmol02G0162700 [Rhododendron molle]|uniref:Uncharacterized protein n=1 Tax=Rhododendron molle TaxID=49168 RepID=A0ACC0PSD4_RHOML|nr:hypothetical protein RHMOL_Rhmol02G0162700 [Rhododendron molle]
MDDIGTLGGDQPPRVEFTSPPITSEGDTMTKGVPETIGVSVQAAMAEEAMASATAVGGNGGDSEVVAGYGQGTKSSGAVEPRGEDEAMGQAEDVVDLEERATEAHDGGGLNAARVEIEASPAKLGVGATGGPQSVEEPRDEAVPRRSVVDEATYVPFQHVVVPTLLDAYRPERTTYDESLVLRDPQQHLSTRQDEEITISFYGSAADVPNFWERLPEAVVRALPERWWDMTNSFHFPFGEMTVTPLDFSAITSLRVGGDPIPYNATTGKSAMFQREMQGFVLMAEKEDARRNRVHISLLPGLRNIEEIARFDWGGAALEACYAFMGSLSRGAGKSLRGYWRVWEVFRRVKKGKGDLNAYRLYLDELHPDRVRWRVWDRFKLPYMARSRESFGIRATWETTLLTRGGRGGRERRGRRRGRGGRGGGVRRDGGQGDSAGPSGTSLPPLSWTVVVVTAQGVPGVVVVPRPIVAAPEFLARATPEYKKEMAKAMMGLEQLEVTSSQAEDEVFEEDEDRDDDEDTIHRALLQYAARGNFPDSLQRVSCLSWRLRLWRSDHSSCARERFQSSGCVPRIEWRIARYLISNGHLNVMRLIEMFSPLGDLADTTYQTRCMTALCMCLLAAYLLVPSTGHASLALISIAVQIEAQKNVILMVLAETLMGLDKVRSGETETFGGSPLLLQVGFSLSSPFSDFSHILILPQHSVWLSRVPHLFSLFYRFGFVIR